MFKPLLHSNGLLCLGLALCLIFLGLPALGATSKIPERNKRPRLDTAAIRKNYLEGELSKVSDSLEAWRQNPVLGSHADSVFVYRHLGIVYASNEANHNRAESYFNLLLRLEPELDVLDPFVSNTVEEFWEKVKLRHAKVAGKRPEEPSKFGERPETVPTPNPKVQAKQDGGFPWLWTLAGTALVGGAVAFYFISQETPSSPPSSNQTASLDTANILIKVPKQP